MDSFQRLAPQQKKVGMIVIVGTFIAILVFIIAIYFSKVGKIDKELADSYTALRVLKSNYDEDAVVRKKFDMLIDHIKRKISNLSFKPFFEKLSNEHKVTIKGITEKENDFNSMDPLSKHFKKIKIEMRLPKISIPKLMTFLVEVEKSGFFLRVEDLKITTLYGGKLFFDSHVVVRGYSLK